MRCVVKMLVEFEALDDPDARKQFRELAAGLTAAIGAAGTIRELKLGEVGVGRPIDRWESESETS